MQLRFLLLMAGLLIGHVRADASQPAATAPDARQSKETRVRQQAVTLAQECQTMVGFRLGHIMSLQVQQVTAPTPPATTWAVIGEDKGQDPAINFICQFRPEGKQWQLEKLDLLQLAPEQPISSSTPATGDPDARAKKPRKE